MKILVFSEIKWSYLKTRKQHLLSRFPDSWYILFFEPYKADKPNNLKPVDVSRWVRNCTVPFLKNFDGVLKALFGNIFIRVLFFYFSGIWIRKIIKKANVDKPDLVIVSNLYAVPYLHFKCPIIYDMNDDHLAFKNTPDWLKHQRETLFIMADKIVVCSESLADLVPKQNKNKVVYIGNGVDVTVFMSSTYSAALTSQELDRAKSE